MRYIDKSNTGICAIETDKLRCLRCGNEDVRKFGCYASYVAKRKIYYCRSCLIFGRICEMTYLMLEELKIPKILRFDFPIQIPPLTDVQQKCVQEVRQLARKEDCVIDVVAVTGAGKTEMMLVVAADFLRDQKFVAFVCPRIDVIRELYERIEKYFPEHLIVGWHQENKTKRIGHIYVMTMHQLIHYENFFDLIIIDEADAYPFMSEIENQMLQRFLERSLCRGGQLIYMTATPKRQHGEQVYLMTKFNKRALPTPRFVHVSFLDKRLKYRIASHFLKRMYCNQWLLFVPSIAIGECLLCYMRYFVKNRNIDFVCSEDIKRAEKIENFRQKEINILISTSILERGVTFEDLSVGLFFIEHPLMTPEMIVQICGRVDRAKEQRPYCLEAYYGVFTDKIQIVTKRIKEMNDKRDGVM